MRGIIPARVMAEIERSSGKPIHRLFDIVVGTSTGGILAVLSGAGIPMRRAVEFYYESGPKIFKGIGRKIFSLGGLVATKYSDKNLTTELRRAVPMRPFGDSLTHTMVTVVRGDNHAGIIKSWDEDGSKWPSWEVAKATSSAQVIFPPHEYKQERWYDGGNVRNNPVVCGLVEAIRLWGPAEDLQILSIGTGVREGGRDLPTGGAVAWVPELFETTTHADDSYDDYTVRMLSEVMSIDYRRFQVTLPSYPALDDARKSTLDAMSNLTSVAVSRNRKLLSL